MRSLKRFLDIFLSLVLIVVFAPLFAVIAIAIKLTTTGSVLHWSNRVGKNNVIFRMPKFRTMSENAPQLATHLLSDPSRYVTSIGSILRKSSFDELPQLFSILEGHLSFVGPRPALFNQDDLIALRTQYGVHCLVPGLTGWAQVNGRDELPIEKKVEFDYEYLQKHSAVFDLRILAMTVVKVVRRDGVSH